MRRSNLPWPACLVLFSIVLLLSACGKKGAPTLRSYDPPAAPSGLTAIHREGRVYLQWTFPKDKEITVQEVAVLRAAEADFVRIAGVEAGARSYSDASVRPGMHYRYRVVARNHRGVFSADSNTAALTAHPVPPPPQGLVAAVTNTALELTWQSQGSGLLYNIYRTEEPGRYDMTPVNRTPLSSPSFTDALMLRKPVYYTVRALTEASVRNESAASAEVAADPDRFIPGPPQGVRHFASESRVFLSWDLPAESWVSGFRIYRKSGPQDYTLLAETQIPSYIDLDPTASERAYRIHVLGPKQESAGVEVRGVRLQPRE